MKAVALLILLATCVTLSQTQQEPSPKKRNRVRKLVNEVDLGPRTVYVAYNDPMTQQKMAHKIQGVGFVAANTQIGSPVLYAPNPFTAATGQVPMPINYQAHVRSYGIETPLNLGQQNTFVDPTYGLHPLNLHNAPNNVYGGHPEMYTNYPSAMAQMLPGSVPFMSPYYLNGPSIPPVGAELRYPATQMPGNFPPMQQRVQVRPVDQNLADAGIEVAGSLAYSNLQQQQSFPSIPYQTGYPGPLDYRVAPQSMMMGAMSPYPMMGGMGINPMMGGMGMFGGPQAPNYYFSPHNSGYDYFDRREAEGRALKSRRKATENKKVQEETRNVELVEQKEKEESEKPIKI